jgi:hypothetical protein
MIILCGMIIKCLVMRLRKEDFAMSNLSKLSKLETAADRREFVLGLTDSNKPNLRSLAAGIISGVLLFKGNKK